MPYVLGTVGILVWGHISDRMNERRWNLAASCFCIAIGFAAAGLTAGTYWSIAGISLGVIGLYASNAHLWPLPSMFLTGAAAASGITPGPTRSAFSPKQVHHPAGDRLDQGRDR